MKVKVFRAPGFEDEWSGELWLHNFTVADDCTPQSVVSDGTSVVAVPSRCVFTPEGLSYAKEWAAKSGRSVFDVRVPDALAVKA